MKTACSLALACLVVHAPRVSAATPPDYSLSGTVIEALEDGPVVVELRLRYHGTKEVFATDSSGPLSSFSSVASAPANWTKREESRTGIVVGPITTPPRKLLKPGEEVRSILFLHHRYRRIPSGRGSVELAHPLRLPGKDWCTTVVEVDVAAAGSKALSTSLQRIRSVVGSRIRGTVNETRAVETLRWANHPEFAAAALDLTKPGGISYRDGEMRRYVFEVSRRSPEVHGLLVAQLGASGSAQDSLYFDLWRASRVLLGDEEVRTLLGSGCTWIQVLTFRGYPSQCAPGTREALLRGLARMRNVIESVADADGHPE